MVILSLAIFINGCIKSEVPTGKIICANGEEIFEIDPIGENMKIITPFVKIGSFSSDGKRIIVGEYEYDKDFKIKKGEIFLWDIKKREYTQLTKGYIDTSPSFSPDGKKIVFSSNRDGEDDELYVMNIDEPKNIIRVTNNSLDDSNPKWSPDGNGIVFESSLDIPELDYWSSDENDPCHKKPNSYEIYVMDADGKNAIRLTSNNKPDKNPCWAPDGERIAFISNGDLCIMDVDDKNLTNLTKDNPHIIKAAGSKNNYSIVSPCWSPDGKFISFTLIAGPKNINIYTINVTNKKVRQITNSSPSKNIAWLAASPLDK